MSGFVAWECRVCGQSGEGEPPPIHFGPRGCLDKDERFTPPELFAELDRVYDFNLDPCGHELSPVTQAIRAKGGHVITDGRSGLFTSWEGRRVFVNPPYTDIEPWIMKALGAAIPLVVMLIPSNRTEQPFWQRWIEPARDHGGACELKTNFLPRRISFGVPALPVRPRSRPEAGSVLLLWDRRFMSASVHVTLK